MQVLVTGAGGFIGSHVVELLAELNYDVRALIHYNSTSDPKFLSEIRDALRPKVNIIFGDVTDRRSVDQAVEGCDYVLHLAALIGIPYSYVAPESYLHTNIEGTLNVLEACRRYGVKRLVQTSTSEVYGNPVYTPIDEKHPLQGQSPYSATKISADKLVESYMLSFDLPAVILRPFNTYGPRQSSRAIIPTIINQLLTHPDRVEVGDLTTQRDFTFVTDTARGFLCAMTTSGVEGKTVHLGTGEIYSVKQIIDLVSKHLKIEPIISSSIKRIRPEQSEIKLLHSTNKFAKELLSWQPTIPFYDGLGFAIEYFRNQPAKWGTDSYVV